jgi:glucokinase
MAGGANGKRVVAMDVGGSHVSAALVGAAGIEGKPVRVDGPFSSYDDFLDRAESAVSQALAGRGKGLAVAAAGCGLPGALDPRTRTLISAPNLPCLVGRPVGSDLEKLLAMPVRVENDANLAALGEYVFGPPFRGETLLCLTLGTGIGGGVVWKGNLLVGGKSSGMELGHVTIHPEGLPCTCGNAGCLESYASIRALERTYLEEHGTALRGRAIIDGARDGEPRAAAIVRRAAGELGIALAGFANIFVPDVVVLCGGIALVGEPLAAAAREVVRARALPGRPRETEVRVSADPLMSVLLGAGAYALK